MSAKTGFFDRDVFFYSHCVFEERWKGRLLKAVIETIRSEKGIEVNKTRRIPRTLPPA